MFFLSLLLWMYSVNFICLRLLPHLMREKAWSAESFSWGLLGPNSLGRRDLKQIDGCWPPHSSPPSAIWFFYVIMPMILSLSIIWNFVHLTLSGPFSNLCGLWFCFGGMFVSFSSSTVAFIFVLAWNLPSSVLDVCSKATWIGTTKKKKRIYCKF